MKNIILQAFMGFLMTTVVFVLFIAIFNASSKGANHELVLDKREWSCVESKTEKYTTTVMIGKVPITQWHNREVCIVMKRN